MRDDFEIVIEYINKLDSVMSGTMEAITAHQEWADPLMIRIRDEWPPSTIRIAFKERELERG